MGSITSHTTYAVERYVLCAVMYYPNPNPNLNPNLNPTGHTAPLIAVDVVNTPQERAVTVDERGIIKIWSLSRGQGILAECIQTIAFDSGAIDNSRISSFMNFRRGM